MPNIVQIAMDKPGFSLQAHNDNNLNSLQRKLSINAYHAQEPRKAA